MAYIAPTPAEIKTRYPEFSAVSDGLITLMIAEAGGYVSTSWVERDYKHAMMLLVCHWLAMEGEPGRSAGGTGGGVSGPMKSRTVGDVRTEFAGFGASAGGASSDAGYEMTAYGRQFLRLLRLNFPAVAVV